MPSLTDQQRIAVDQVLRLRRETETFRRNWPPLNSRDELAPAFTWTELERQLASLAVNAQSARMASDLVSATRKQASFKPPELVLREILCVAGVLMDENFPPSGQPDVGEAPMT